MSKINAGSRLNIFGVHSVGEAETLFNYLKNEGDVGERREKGTTEGNRDP
jgi:hypothetical protein